MECVTFSTVNFGTLIGTIKTEKISEFIWLEIDLPQMKSKLCVSDLRVFPISKREQSPKK